MRKVRSIFPTGNRTRVAGLRSGQRYAWRVWPFDRARGGYTTQPLGLSWFELRRPIRPSRTEMGTDRRIAASALRKAAAIEAWLDAGIAAGDLRHEGLGAAAFDPALQPTGSPDAGGTAAASVRPIVVPAGPRGRARLPVDARELRQTKRIARGGAGARRGARGPAGRRTDRRRRARRRDRPREARARGGPGTTPRGHVRRAAQRRRPRPRRSGCGRSARRASTSSPRGGSPRARCAAPRRCGCGCCRDSPPPTSSRGTIGSADLAQTLRR